MIKKRFEKIFDIEQKLSEIQDVDVLLENILIETQKLVNADAGSIYVVQNDIVKIKYARNNTNQKKLAEGMKLPYISFSFPINESQICGYVALTGRSLNIKDCYKISKSKPYKFNPETDQKTGYRTKSMFTYPLKMPTGKVLGVIQIINALDEEGNVVPFTKKDEKIIEHFALRAVSELVKTNLTKDLIRRTLKMAEFRDPKETYSHVERVSAFSMEIYDKYAYIKKIDAEEQRIYRDNLRIAAKYHDVGKVGISDVILKKVSPRFTEEERNIMKGHTCIGAQLFDPEQSLLEKMSWDITLHHHDRWDGSEYGYPGDISKEDVFIKVGEIIPECKPLSKEDIPLSARIVAVADVFDALSCKRCYKDAWSLEDAFNEIKRCSGSQFDPEIVDAFLQVKDRIIAIKNAYPDLD